MKLTSEERQVIAEVRKTLDPILQALPDEGVMYLCDIAIKRAIALTDDPELTIRRILSLRKVIDYQAEKLASEIKP